MTTEQYEPTTEDITYTTNLIAMAKDGAFWGWPGTGAIYKLLKARKVFIEINPNDTTNRARMKAVAKAIGWTVIEQK